jgi:hypothetical protein
MYSALHGAFLANASNVVKWQAFAGFRAVWAAGVGV